MSLFTCHWITLVCFSQGVVFSCLITSFSVLFTYTSLMKNWKNVMGFWARSTYNTVIKVIYSYVLCLCGAKIQKYIFSSNELVHVCWIFRWYILRCLQSNFGLIFLFLLLPHTTSTPNVPKSKEGKGALFGYIAPLIWQWYWIFVGYLKGLLASVLDDQDCQFELASFSVICWRLSTKHLQRLLLV